MSSDDDDAILQRHKSKLAPALVRARPPVASGANQTAQARQSKEALPQKVLQRTVSNTQPGKTIKSSTAAAVEQDSDDDDAQLLKRHLKLQQQSKVNLLQAAHSHMPMPGSQLELRTHVQAPPRVPATGSRLTSRVSSSKAALDGLNRTTSSLSTSRQAVAARPADSDSDTDIATGGRLRSRAETQQHSRKPSKATGPARDKQQTAVSAESDSDDALMHRRSKKMSQSAGALSQKAKLADTVDRRTSKDSRGSTADRPSSQPILSSAAATSSKWLAGRQTAAANLKLQAANVESTDNDSDEEHWKAISAKAYRIRPPQAGPVQVHSPALFSPSSLHQCVRSKSVTIHMLTTSSL